jgi:class 3 adenylate cyclase
MLSELFLAFDDLVAERGLEKIKTIGDSYMAAGGLPEPLDDHAHRIVDLALAMLGSARRFGTDPAPSTWRAGSSSKACRAVSTSAQPPAI